MHIVYMPIPTKLTLSFNSFNLEDWIFIMLLTLSSSLQKIALKSSMF